MREKKNHLTPAEYQILAVLRRGENHGYGIMKDAKELMKVKIAFGTLYRTIGNLLEAGLIEVSGEDEDSSRRFYQITGVGEQAVKDEAHRLWELAKAGGATEPIPGLAFAAPVGGS